MTMFLIIRDISSFDDGIYNLFQKCGLSPPNWFVFSQSSSLPGIEFCMLCCHAAKSDNSLTHVYSFIPIRLITRGPDEAARCSGVLCWHGEVWTWCWSCRKSHIATLFPAKNTEYTFLSGFDSVNFISGFVAFLRDQCGFTTLINYIFFLFLRELQKICIHLMQFYS